MYTNLSKFNKLKYGFSANTSKMLVKKCETLSFHIIANEAERARKKALSHVVVDEFHLQNLKIATTRKLTIFRYGV